MFCGGTRATHVFCSYPQLLDTQTLKSVHLSPHRCYGLLVNMRGALLAYQTPLHTRRPPEIAPLFLRRWQFQIPESRCSPDRQSLFELSAFVPSRASGDCLCVGVALSRRSGLARTYLCLAWG